MKNQFMKLREVMQNKKKSPLKDGSDGSFRGLTLDNTENIFKATFLNSILKSNS